MSFFMTANEYAKKEGISTRTVYRWAEEGKIEAEKVDGTWRIYDNSNLNSGVISQLQQTIERQDKEIEYFKQELSKANEELAEQRQILSEERQRHDTIVMSISNQLADERKKLEDMRNQKLWTRFKSALGFASS